MRLLIFTTFVFLIWGESIFAINKPPNVIFILADDLGYGDLGCYGAELVKTPNIDSLARGGRLFTDVHSPASICVPTRYSLLTGKEYFRIVQRWSNFKCRIDPQEHTLGKLFKSAGYSTAMIGKWHLGFGKEEPDWNGKLIPGPIECGFDYFFGTANSHNHGPKVLVRNHRVIGLDPNDPIRFTNADPPRVPKPIVEGGASARFIHEELGLIHSDEAVEFIRKNKSNPFFLYYPTIAVHGPITPGPNFRGSSKMGRYGDFIQELDWSVGEILKTLTELDLAGDTIVVFTSDNGAVLQPFTVNKGHQPNGKLLGQKTDVWEGGHRVPFIVKWPGKVPESSRSTSFFTLTDMLSTFSSLLSVPLKEGEGPDSFDMSGAMFGGPNSVSRPHSAFFGSDSGENTVVSEHGLAIREGKWVLIPQSGSGGYSSIPDIPWLEPWELGRETPTHTVDGILKSEVVEGQLYNLEVDPEQRNNLYKDYPETVQRLRKLLTRLVNEGHSKF